MPKPSIIKITSVLVWVISVAQFSPVRGADVWKRIDKNGTQSSSTAPLPEMSAVFFKLSNRRESPGPLLEVKQDRLTGFADATGKIIVSPLYETVRHYHNGHYLVQKNGSSAWLVLDESGTPKYSLPLGLEPLGDFEYKNELKEGIIFAESKTSSSIGMRGLYDLQKAKFFPVSKNCHVYGFSEGVSRIQDSASPFEFGFVDCEGHFLIKEQYGLALDFHEGLAAVRKDNRWSYINSAGNTVIELPDNCSYAGSFCEGLASVAIGGEATEASSSIRPGAKWGFIDKTGKLVIPAKYYVDRLLEFESAPGRYLMEDNNFAPRFRDGLAPVATGSEIDRRYGYIDHSGKWVISPQFKDATEFANGSALVCYGKTGFDPELWNARWGPYVSRSNSFRLFTLEYKLIGMDRARVNELLGRPTVIHLSSDSYDLRTSPCGNDEKSVDIDYENGTVVKYFYVRGRAGNDW